MKDASSRLGAVLLASFLGPFDVLHRNMVAIRHGMVRVFVIPGTFGRGNRRTFLKLSLAVGVNGGFQEALLAVGRYAAKSKVESHGARSLHGPRIFSLALGAPHLEDIHKPILFLDLKQGDQRWLD